MLLLRESSEKLGVDPNLEAALGRGDGGIPHGDALLRFGEAVTRGSDDADAARAELLRAVGREAFVEAAGIVGIFNGLVRTADASGIPLDDGTLNGSVGFRDALGLNAFGGAANSDLAAASATRASPDVESVFR